jgi:hypothetical protein
MEEEERLSIRKWLHPDGINVEASFTSAFAARLSDTGQWLLCSEEFAAWKGIVHGCMWLYGIGKYLLEIFRSKTNSSSSWVWENCALVGKTSFFAVGC